MDLDTADNAELDAAVNTVRVVRKVFFSCEELHNMVITNQISEFGFAEKP